MSSSHDAQARDAALADELRAHHMVMIADLDRLCAALADAYVSGDEAADAKEHLVRWIADVLVPHAAEEEPTTYRAAAELPEGAALIRSMVAEHELIRLLARRMSDAENPKAAGAFALALFDVFDSHQRKENDIILPMLVHSDAVSLTDVMGTTHSHHRGHGHSQ